MSKRQEIEKIINELLQYGLIHGFPYFDNKEKIDKFKKEYTTDVIAGLVNKYMVPAYDDSVDTLKDYLKVEIERAKILGLMNGIDPNYLNFKLTDLEEKFVLNCIVRIIKIIKS